MCEQERINFIIQRDGIEGAVDFCKRTMKIYRTAVLRSRKRGHDKPHHASIPEFRRRFITSYCAFKKFAAQNS